MTRARAALLLLLGLALVAAPARADLTRFSSFDVAAEEEDDENLIDHVLSRAPENWRDEWERSAAGLRADQGCMTSGIWRQANQFKQRAPLGSRSWLDLGFEQVADPEASWQWLRFDFRFPTRAGLFGVRFQPAYDKSQHDFAALYDAGTDSSALQAQVAFTLEDTFNSFWEFHQTRVGNHAEPYRRHPYEPSLRLVSRGARHRAEVTGRWLTPSRKNVIDVLPALSGTESLWGSEGAAEAEVRPGGWRLLGRLESVAARSSQRFGTSPGDDRLFRRRWSAEAALGRVLAPRVTAEIRGIHQQRVQEWAGPAADATLRARDRMVSAEVAWHPRGEWRTRFGLMYDRIRIERRGAVPDFTWGTRKESRAYIGLEGRFGRVRVQGIEGIELDHEAYDVSFHHDKGFLHLMTTF